MGGDVVVVGVVGVECFGIVVESIGEGVDEVLPELGEGAVGDGDYEVGGVLCISWVVYGLAELEGRWKMYAPARSTK